jgi:ribosomal-protein-alanine N-acetyltransferase
MTFELRTNRLVLRPVCTADVLELHELWTGSGVRRYLWDDEIISLERTRAAVEESMRLFKKYAYGLWAGRDAQTEGLIAFAGFWYFREPPELELLYGVRETMWRQGFAAEAAAAVVEYGRQTLDMRCIRASTDAANAASLRVLEKLGFSLDHRQIAGRADTLFYALRSEPT